MPDDEIPPDETPDDEELEEQDSLPPPVEAVEVERPPTPAIHAGGFLEYRAPDATQWRCDHAADLFTDFKIMGADAEKLRRLTDWHQIMSPVPNTWQMLRRWYRVAPLAGNLSPDDMREWSKEELARALGFSVALFDKQLEEAWDFWHRVQMERELANRMVESAGAEVLDETKIGELVTKHGFQTVPPSEHPYVAMRVMDMSQLFDMAEGRMLAQSAIFQELMIRATQRAIGTAMSGGEAKAAELAKLYDTLQKLNGSYEGTLQKLGATQDQNPNFRQRVAFNDCMGQITKAMTAYYAEEDTTLIDGVFTASEVKLLLTPTTLRPMQYRPDLVLLAADWRNNFWRPDYVAAKLPRMVMQRLTKGFEEGVRAQTVEDGEVLQDMEGDDDAMLDIVGEALKEGIDEREPGADVGVGLPEAIVPLPEEGGRRGRVETYVAI